MELNIGSPLVPASKSQTPFPHSHNKSSHCPKIHSNNQLLGDNLKNLSSHHDILCPEKQKAFKFSQSVHVESSYSWMLFLHTRGLESPSLSSHTHFSLTLITFTYLSFAHHPRTSLERGISKIINHRQCDLKL